MLLGAKAGDVIWCFKTDGDKMKAGVSINLMEIGISKYKEVLMTTVKIALEILGYGSSKSIESEIFCLMAKKPKNKNNDEQEKSSKEGY